MAHDPELIASHLQEGLDNLVSMFQDATNIKSLLEIVLAGQVQDLEQTTYDLWEKCLLENAEGAQLDQYGRIVGQSRMDLSDDEFRRMILVRVQINLGKGEATRVISVMTQVLDDTFRYAWLAPAWYQVFWVSGTPISGSWMAFVLETLMELTPAGVGWYGVEAPTGDYWKFDTPLRGVDIGKLGKMILMP